MIIGKTRTNQPVEGDDSALAKSLENQDVVVKTIEQQEANWSFDVEEFPSTTNCTSTPIFCRIQQLNKELHIVMLGKITNPTENDITIYSTGAVWVTLPESIANKIVDVLGKKVSETPAHNTRISTNYASCFGDGNTAVDMSKYASDVVMHLVNLTDANKIAIEFARPSNITLKAGQDTYFESRVSLDLI